MKKEDHILKIAEENNGIILAKTLREKQLPTAYLSRMVKNGNLIKLSAGVYSTLEKQDILFAIQKRYPNSIFSLETAFYLHGLIDELTICLTVLNGDNVNNLKKFAPISVNYTNKELHQLGVVEVKTPFGNKVLSYDIDKTFCDFVKLKNKMPAKRFRKMVQVYLNSRNKNLNKAFCYDKKLNITQKVSDVLLIME